MASSSTKPAIGLGLRLMTLHRELSAVIARLSPRAIAVEQAFVARDPSAALKLGHARAVALLAAAEAGLEIAEYSPNHIKKCVVGAGHAGKEPGAVHGQAPLARLRRQASRRRRRAGGGDHACASVRHAGAHDGSRSMIGKLTGIVDSIAEDAVILDVGGVGYLVQCPSSTLSRLAVGAHVSLMIEMKVSDDAIRLYGFASAEEREWFRLLQTVQNVGSQGGAVGAVDLVAARVAAGAGPVRQGDDRARARAWAPSWRCASPPN